MPTREERVIDTFLALNDTLVSDFDAAAFLAMLAARSVELLDVSAAGIILRDGHGGMSVAAASSERSRLLEMFAVAVDSGPCVDCLGTGRPVVCGDLTGAEASRRWPRFVAGAAEAGFRAVHALPMRLRGEVLGVLGLMHTDLHDLSAPDRRLGQALADAATIGLVHEREVRHAEALSEQLHGALQSRIVIEQAKGALAHRAGVSTAEAFVLLRGHARSRGMRLADLAPAVVDGSVDLAAIAPPGR